jgi:hypothetical protein
MKRLGAAKSYRITLAISLLGLPLACLCVFKLAQLALSGGDRSAITGWFILLIGVVIISISCSAASQYFKARVKPKTQDDIAVETLAMLAKQREQARQRTVPTDVKRKRR